MMPIRCHVLFLRGSFFRNVDRLRVQVCYLAILWKTSSILAKNKVSDFHTHPCEESNDSRQSIGFCYCSSPTIWWFRDNLLVGLLFSISIEQSLEFLCFWPLVGWMSLGCVVFTCWYIMDCFKNFSLTILWNYDNSYYKIHVMKFGFKFQQRFWSCNSIFRFQGELACKYFQQAWASYRKYTVVWREY